MDFDLHPTFCSWDAISPAFQSPVLSTWGAVMLKKNLKNTNVGPKFLPLKAYTLGFSLKKTPRVRSDDKYILTVVMKQTLESVAVIQCQR